jgi:ubiquinone/menaquinone biosynthesis C-methylase UbiE
VLEVGIGSGLNLPFYPAAVRHVIGIDNSEALLALAARMPERRSRSVELIRGSAEALSLEDRSVDTVVTTWTLCSIPDIGAALAEIRRVLRPDGQLLFAEHGRSPDPGVSRWQDRLTPVWKHLVGGCHLNRPVREMLEASGFRIEHIDTGYIAGPRPLTFMSEGRATPA